MTDTTTGNTPDLSVVTICKRLASVRGKGGVPGCP